MNEDEMNAEIQARIDILMKIAWWALQGSAVVRDLQLSESEAAKLRRLLETYLQKTVSSGAEDSRSGDDEAQSPMPRQPVPLPPRSSDPNADKAREVPRGAASESTKKNRWMR